MRPFTLSSRTARWIQALPSALVSATLATSSIALSACDSCGTQKPYTPFGMASALPEATPSAPPPAASEASTAAPTPSSGFSARKAELVPGAPSSWQGSGLNLTAPEARGFAQVLPADFDADGTSDAVAWLVPAANAKDAPLGELWYFPSGAPARRLSALPGFVPSSPECALTPTLTQSGEHSATLDVKASCKSQLIERAPSRAILVVSPSIDHPLLLTLRVSSAAPDETLDFSVDSSDQDHDGRDDVRLRASLIGPGATDPESADLLWFDRAAGASRSASEPMASLLRQAEKLAPRAHGKRAAEVPPRIAALRRLLSSLCAEGGVARVFDEDGTPFRCGDLSKVGDSLTLSEASSAIAQSDVLAAFSVLQRDGWYFGKLSNPARKNLDRELLRAVTKFDADPPLVARAQPALPALPHFSPLWFDVDGSLLIRTATAVSRVAADRSSEEAASTEGGAPSWPLDLALPNGQRILGAVHACDRSELLLTQSDAGHPLTTPLLAARPASCSGHGSGPNVSIAPLSFDENGLDALLAGAHVSLAPAGKKQVPTLPAMGTPRSPDGRWLVAPTPIGLLLIGERNELWQLGKLSEHGDAARLSDCVVANAAHAVACIDAGRAILFERPKPSASTTSTHKK